MIFCSVTIELQRMKKCQYKHAMQRSNKKKRDRMVKAPLLFSFIFCRSSKGRCTDKSSTVKTEQKTQPVGIQLCLCPCIPCFSSQKEVPSSPPPRPASTQYGLANLSLPDQWTSQKQQTRKEILHKRKGKSTKQRNAAVRLQTKCMDEHCGDTLPYSFTKLGGKEGVSRKA
jgi:hypothetical protein